MVRAGNTAIDDELRAAAKLTETLVTLFITGLTLGISQCLLSCAPVLVFYITGSAEGWREGLKASLIFSLARLFAYTMLGALAGVLGMSLVDYLHQGSQAYWVQLGAGIFVLLLGLLILMGRNPQLHICSYLSQHTVRNSMLSMSLLGFLMGIAPACAPFLGILTYIAFAVKEPLLGALCGFFFGLGAALITPALLIGTLAGAASKLFQSQLLLEVFRRASGVVLLLFGIRLLAKTVMGNL